MLFLEERREITAESVAFFPFGNFACGRMWNWECVCEGGCQRGHRRPVDTGLSEFN